ncbi:MAG: four helix bundle protein [Opitutaceae bacterium]|jgi:four helix bundle protein|nr:four helix bundle protein [Opitutaceae bacterium]
MKKFNIITEKSYNFAVRIVNLYMFLSSDKKEYVLSKQLLRCGTSIGANVEEAQGGQSRADFLTKITIAYKEARETAYWLRLLKDTKFLTQKQFGAIYPDVEELIRIITAIQRGTKGD